MKAALLTLALLIGAVLPFVLLLSFVAAIYWNVHV